MKATGLVQQVRVQKCFMMFLENSTEGLTLEEYKIADEKQQLVEIWNDVFMEYQKDNGKVVGKPWLPKMLIQVQGLSE